MDYKWVDGNWDELFVDEYKCDCGASMEFLVVTPRRSKTYLNRILLCPKRHCRKIIPL